MAPASKLTEELLAKLDAVADSGCSIQAACRSIGITPPTWRKWEARTDPDDLTVSFVSAAARVRARANTGMDDKCDGVIEAALDDPDVKPTDKAALAIQWKRLHGTHKIEVSGASFAAMLDAAESSARDADA